ncbi:MAG: FecR domain-containing protein [Cytophagales bacterium]|nr:FecR domain-containing protein [Cytophaga sp.]
MKYDSIPNIDRWYETIAAYKQGELSEQQVKELFIWKNENAEHAAFFEQTEKTWSVSREKIQFPEFDTSKAWEMVKAQTFAAPIRSNEASYSNSWKPFMSAAAAVLALIVISFLLSKFLITKPTFTDLATAGEMKEFTLPDSSKVWLHDSTTLRYSSAYGEEERMVFLDGEAFFEVRKNAAKPFTVLSYRSRVIVKGTSFLVRSRKNDSIDVIEVEEGKVAVLEKYSRSGEEIMLTKGMKATVNVYGALQKCKEPISSNTASWRTNRLMFDHTPLRIVVMDLKKQANITVLIEQKQAENCRFTGEFDNSHPEEIMQILSLSMDMQVVKVGGTYILKGKACSK